MKMQTHPYYSMKVRGYGGKEHVLQNLFRTPEFVRVYSYLLFFVDFQMSTDNFFALSSECVSKQVFYFLFQFGFHNPRLVDVCLWVHMDITLRIYQGRQFVMSSPLISSSYPLRVVARTPDDLKYLSSPNSNMFCHQLDPPPSNISKVHPSPIRWLTRPRE